MKHYRCFIRMVECLDDEVPLFTRGLLWLCVAAPYVITGVVFGPDVMAIVVAATCVVFTSMGAVLGVVYSALDNYWLYKVVRQFERLPRAIRKCAKCVEDADD